MSGMNQPGTMPAGTKVYYCPLCDWLHTQPPVTERESIEAIGDPVSDIILRMILPVEAELQAHLETHSLVEWVTKVGEQQRALEVLRTEVTRLSSEKTRVERDSALVAACLVRKAGGSVTVSDAEMVTESGTLVRIPEMHGFTLTVVDRATNFQSFVADLAAEQGPVTGEELNAVRDELAHDSGDEPEP